MPTLTRLQASALYSALAAIESGLSAANAIVAADNLLALRPVVEAFDKAKLATDRALLRLPGVTRADGGYRIPPDQAAASDQLGDALQVVGEQTVELQLLPIELSADEITAAKISPRQLAPLRAHLKPVKS